MPEKTEWELYDLKADPSERRNLAESEPKLLTKAEKMMDAAHVESPHWPDLKSQ